MLPVAAAFGAYLGSPGGRQSVRMGTGEWSMLQVGFGVADITPVAGMEMPGGFSHRKGKEARDPLLAVACVVHDGSSTVALVGIDTAAVLGSTVERARRL